MAQFTSERIAKLESELQAARKELAARPAILSNPELISNSEATPVSELQPNPAPSPSAPDLDSDVFYPNTVTDGVCTLEACGKKKVGMPSAAIRDKIVYLDLTLCDAQEIADHAFVGCANLKRVVLPLSMVIGEESFSDCPNLEEVYLEYTPRIGDRAFCNCVSLKKVYFTSRRTEIGTDAFAGCPEVAFRCRKNSTAAAYAEEHSFDIF